MPVLYQWPRSPDVIVQAVIATGWPDVAGPMVMSQPDVPALPSNTAVPPEVFTRNHVACVLADAFTFAGRFGESTEGSAAEAAGAKGVPSVKGPATSVPSAPPVPDGCVPLYRYSSPALPTDVPIELSLPCCAVDE